MVEHTTDNSPLQAGVALPLIPNGIELYDAEGSYVGECDRPETAAWLVFAANSHNDAAEVQSRFEKLSTRTMEQGSLLATIQKKLELIMKFADLASMTPETNRDVRFAGIHAAARELLAMIQSGGQGKKENTAGGVCRCSGKGT